MSLHTPSQDRYSVLVALTLFGHVHLHHTSPSMLFVSARSEIGTCTFLSSLGHAPE